MKIVFTVILAVTVAAEVQAAPRKPIPGILLLDDHESSLDTNGDIGDAKVDSSGTSIAEPQPLGPISETKVPRIPRRPLKKEGKIDAKVFSADLTRNFADIETCRLKVAAAAGVPLTKVIAGAISLHWTVLPSGRTRDTVVLETAKTDLAVMKCVRRRMNAWTFGKPVGGPVHADYDYVFRTIATE